MEDDGTDSNGGWQDFFGGLARDASQAYAANQNAQAKPKTRATTAAPATDYGKFIKPAAIVIGALVVVGVLVKMFKK